MGRVDDNIEALHILTETFFGSFAFGCGLSRYVMNSTRPTTASLLIIRGVSGIKSLSSSCLHCSVA